MIEAQSTELEREVTVIQFIPFSEYAAVADGLDATATKRPITELYVTEFHLDVLGIVIEVQLAPPSEYAPELESVATATNLFVVGLHATEDHVKELGSPGDAAVHVVPLSEYDAAVEATEMVTKRPVVELTVKALQNPEGGVGIADHVDPLSEYAPILTEPTATKRPAALTATPIQFPALGRVFVAEYHVIPSSE